MPWDDEEVGALRRLHSVGAVTAVGARRWHVHHGGVERSSCRDSGTCLSALWLHLHANGRHKAIDE
eukprot:1634745-Pleurochrysis_carterae.AAC.1